MHRFERFRNFNRGDFLSHLVDALAYIGLVNYDRVSLYAFNDRLQYEMAGMRGQRLTAQMLEFITNLELDGGSHLANACKHYAIRHPQRGIVIVLSDFLDKNGYEVGLRYLLGRDLDLYVIQVLSPEELDPNLIGDLKLVDIEDGDVAEITVTRALINRYKQTVQSYCQSLKEYSGLRPEYALLPGDDTDAHRAFACHVCDKIHARDVLGIKIGGLVSILLANDIAQVVEAVEVDKPGPPLPERSGSPVRQSTVS